MAVKFQNRAEAGRLLAGKLEGYAGREGVIVLGLPRGGVLVAREVAAKLKAPLDVFLVRKLGVPGHEEVAMGAVAGGGVCFFNESLIESCRIPRRVLEEVVERERKELARREQAYRRAGPPVLRDRTVILVDDGLATGATMRAAARAARQQQPARLVAAAPVAAPETLEQLREEVDEAVCVLAPEDFRAVGEWYEDFGQTTDEEARAALQQEADDTAISRRASRARGWRPPAC
ncbi:MAG: phosphoribosyltransferase family protein [Verrucomicrobiota bacterium]|jgi:predicted phosphoribosyltransferase